VAASVVWTEVQRPPFWAMPDYRPLGQWPEGAPCHLPPGAGYLSLLFTHGTGYPEPVSPWRAVVGVLALFALGCLLGWSFSWGVITSGLALAAIGVVSVAAISGDPVGAKPTECPRPPVRRQEDRSRQASLVVTTAGVPSVEGARAPKVDP
jgi:hypothetical protein